MDVIFVNTTTYLSLILGVPALYLSGLVIAIYWKEALKAIRMPTRERPDWILIGVLISFLGTVGDGAFWQAAWSSKWWDLSLKTYLFDLGPASNIGFRQACDIAAALCHILGALSVKGLRFRAILWRSVALAMAAALLYGVTG